MRSFGETTCLSAWLSSRTFSFLPDFGADPEPEARGPSILVTGWCQAGPQSFCRNLGCLSWRFCLSERGEGLHRGLESSPRDPEAQLGLETC